MNDSPTPPTPFQPGYLTGPAELLLQGRNQMRSDKEPPGLRLPHKLSRVPGASLLSWFSPFFIGIQYFLLRYLSTFGDLLQKDFLVLPPQILPLKLAVILPVFLLTGLLLDKEVNFKWDREPLDCKSPSRGFL